MEEEYLALIERTLDEVLPATTERPVALSKAMRYAVGTGGKRIRPLICLAASVAAGGVADDAKYPAAAIELLHNYTLVHDDLPAMDGDRERRGRPTVWVEFSEADAILAGDALQALAFKVAARAPRNVAAIVDALGSKGVGVVRGQVEDVAAQAEGMRPTDPAFVYARKTADLFVAAAVMGGLAGGGGAAEVAALEDFARDLGLAFQYEDDLIDGDGALSKGETESLVKTLTDAAVAALAKLPGDTTFLKNLSNKLIGRTC